MDGWDWWATVCYMGHWSSKSWAVSAYSWVCICHDDTTQGLLLWAGGRVCRRRVAWVFYNASLLSNRVGREKGRSFEDSLNCALLSCFVFGGRHLGQRVGNHFLLTEQKRRLPVRMCRFGGGCGEADRSLRSFWIGANALFIKQYSFAL